MQVQSTQTQNKLHPTIQRLLGKKFSTQAEVDDFLSWDLKKLPNFSEMKDLKKTAIRIIEAIENKQIIGIYGDYDVDGTTSCALFYHFFKLIGIEVKLYQPSRFAEGYGLHLHSIDNAIDDNVSLLITVDCGITNVDAAAYAKSKNLDLIITDHHKDAAQEMPPAYAIVNPNRRDEESVKEMKTLAGVGVAFAVCVKTRELLLKKKVAVPSIYRLLQYVAIGTICDLAKLTPMNMKMVRHGLKSIKEDPYPGIRIFFNNDELKQRIIPSEKCSFNIGPLINSKGRLDHPEKALELLICDDATSALENYRHLEISNNERKFIQSQVYKEAKKQVLRAMQDDKRLINIVYEPHWHEGVIGIVASKLVETFRVPAIVFADSDEMDIIKASCRSAGHLNIFDALKACEDLFIKFGGHKAAAGLSMPKKNLSEFQARMNAFLTDIPEIQRTKQEHYDLELQFNEIDATLLRQLEMLEPFGMGNAKPVFRMNAQIESYQVFKDAHVRWNFKSDKMPGRTLKGISFNYIGKWGHLSPQDLFDAQINGPLKIEFTLSINNFRGNEYIQLMVDQIKES